MSTFLKAYEKLLSSAQSSFTALHNLSAEGVSVPLALSSEPCADDGTWPADAHLFLVLAPSSAQEAKEQIRLFGKALQARRPSEADEFDALSGIVLVNRNESERKGLFEELRPEAHTLTEGLEPLAIYSDSLAIAKEDAPFSDAFLRYSEGNHTLIDYDGNKPLGVFRCA